MAHDPDHESVGRGALSSLATLPLAVLLTLPPLPLERLWLGVVCLALPFAARFLYTRGSGGYVVRGKPVIAAFTGLGLVLAVLTSTLVTSHVAYSAAGGTGSLLSGEFLAAVGWNFANFTAFDLFFSLIVAAVTGVPALVLVLITARKPPIRKISETAQA
jgi:hypothetical protein